MVSPTEAAVERAKAFVHLDNKENKPKEKKEKEITITIDCNIDLM